MQRPLPNRIVLASHNAGKVSEFERLFRGYETTVVSAGTLGLPAPDETGATFAENALLKAEAASLATGQFALADDSGLCVKALGNQPGLYSARWAGSGNDFLFAMQKILTDLGTNTDRSAFFMCSLALYWPDGYGETIEGRVDGSISHQPIGTNGHGYDPIFIPDGETETFAQMDAEKKNALSHRGRAMHALLLRFQNI